MNTHFFFYKNMKDPLMISRISPFYQTKDGQISIKNYNCLQDKLEIDSTNQENKYKLNGKIISFNLDLQNCLQRLQDINLDPDPAKKYYIEQVSALSLDDNQYYQTYVIY